MKNNYPNQIISLHFLSEADLQLLVLDTRRTATEPKRADTNKTSATDARAAISTEEM